MKEIKISTVFNFSDWDSSVIIHLFRNLSKRKIKIVRPDNADIIFIGPYNINSYKEKITKFFFKKNSFLGKIKYFENIDIHLFKRNYNPIRIFFSFENFRYHNINADFFITSDLAISNSNHLRFPSWKDYFDWSTSENIFRDPNTLNSKRFGCFWNMEKLIRPLGAEFLDRNKKFCIFSSHLTEPRKSIYEFFKYHFEVDGYGPYFDNKIKNHNESSFKSQDILKKYSFNLCPQNSLFPGYYTEGLVNSFYSGTLPITWADNNIGLDFNHKSFINLIDDSKNNYREIIENLKSEMFLKKFTKEPLLFDYPNLDQEKKFIQKILDLL